MGSFRRKSASRGVEFVRPHFRVWPARIACLKVGYFHPGPAPRPGDALQTLTIRSSRAPAVAKFFFAFPTPATSVAIFIYRYCARRVSGAKTFKYDRDWQPPLFSVHCDISFGDIAAGAARSLIESARQSRFSVVNYFCTHLSKLKSI